MEHFKKLSLFEKVLIYWLPVILWAIVIFGFSANTSVSVSEVHWQDFVVKKIAHMTEYGVFTLLLYRALLASGVNKREAGYYSVILIIAYAFSDEFHQSFTPGREPTIRDVMFDTIGGIVSIYFVWKLLPRMPRKLRNLAEHLQIS